MSAKLAFSISFAALILASPVFVQDATSGALPVKRPVPTFQQRKDNIQDKLADFRAKIASREAALKAKLDAFRDKRKAQIAQRVNANLNTINQNQTNQMLKFLQKASEILDKLEARVNQNTPDIKDPASAKAAIADAKTKIASAEAAVNTQAQNNYTIQVSSETTVKKDAQAQREKLHSDLLAVRKLVIDAKQAVVNAIRVAKSGNLTSPATQSAKEATASGQ